MSKGDSARQHEEMARLELIQRIQLRDNAMLIFLAAIGAIFGLVGGTEIGKEILLVTPYLAFSAATIVEYHNIMIGLSGHYLVVELDSYYRKIDEYIPQWDGSASAQKTSTTRPWLLQRKFGHLILIGTPSAVALAANASTTVLKNLYLMIAFVLGLFSPSLLSF
jgi:hypothetical protein